MRLVSGSGSWTGGHLAMKAAGVIPPDAPYPLIPRIIARAGLPGKGADQPAARRAPAWGRRGSCSHTTGASSWMVLWRWSGGESAERQDAGGSPVAEAADGKPVETG